MYKSIYVIKDEVYRLQKSFAKIMQILLSKVSDPEMHWDLVLLFRLRRGQKVPDPIHNTSFLCDFGHILRRDDGSGSVENSDVSGGLEA